jgi:formate hydrogenlyase subunit 4
MTGYSKLLFDLFASPETGSTFTWTLTGDPNVGAGRSLKMTVFVSPGLMTEIVCIRRMTGSCLIVSVTMTGSPGCPLSS